MLTKCKESIKTNKQKNSALTETNRSLSDQVTERESECERLRHIEKDFEAFKKKAREEELQIAETKMIMHQVINYKRAHLINKIFELLPIYEFNRKWRT